MSKDRNLKIVFFGTPEFAVASLAKILEAGYEVAAVVTMPDKIAGRGHKLIQSDVKKFASQQGLKVLQPENLKSPLFISELKEINADVFVVIAFRMLPEAVWSMPPRGTFNLHASLLPKYRGAAPINRAVMNGDTKTGVTTFFLKHEIDTGDIIQQKEITILPDDDAGNVHDKLMSLGADMVVDSLNDIKNGDVKTYPQPEGDYLPAPKIYKETCKINFEETALRIHNKVRGLAPYPGAYAMVKDSEDNVSEIKIFKTRLPENIIIEKGNPGTLVIKKDRLFVITGDSPLEIMELQPAGKRRMTADAYLRGYHPIKLE